MLQPSPHDTFVIAGVITELQVALGSEELLAQIHLRYKTGSTAPVGLHDQLATAASVALYGGEDTQHFVCLIDGQAVRGTFGGAGRLPVGKKVKAVVSQQGDVLIAHGILSEETGLLWVPCVRGGKAERVAMFKLPLGCFCFTMVCLTACTFFVGGYPGMSELETLLWGAIVTGALCFGMAIWDITPLNGQADPANDIFRKLGFADPEWVDLDNYRYGIVQIHELIRSQESAANHADIYCCKKAIADGKLKLADPIHDVALTVAGS